MKSRGWISPSWWLHLSLRHLTLFMDLPYPMGMHFALLVLIQSTYLIDESCVRIAGGSFLVSLVLAWGALWYPQVIFMKFRGVGFCLLGPHLWSLPYPLVLTMRWKVEFPFLFLTWGPLSYILFTQNQLTLCHHPPMDWHIVAIPAWIHIEYICLISYSLVQFFLWVWSLKELFYKIGTSGVS